MSIASDLQTSIRITHVTLWAFHRRNTDRARDRPARSAVVLRLRSRGGLVVASPYRFAVALAAGASAWTGAVRRRAAVRLSPLGRCSVFELVRFGVPVPRAVRRGPTGRGPDRAHRSLGTAHGHAAHGAWPWRLGHGTYRVIARGERRAGRLAQTADPGMQLGSLGTWPGVTRQSAALCARGTSLTGDPSTPLYRVWCTTRSTITRRVSHEREYRE